MTKTSIIAKKLCNTCFNKVYCQAKRLLKDNTIYYTPGVKVHVFLHLIGRERIIESHEMRQFSWHQLWAVDNTFHWCMNNTPFQKVQRHLGYRASFS